jgi:hypothetical protein
MTVSRATTKVIRKPPQVASVRQLREPRDSRRPAVDAELPICLLKVLGDGRPRDPERLSDLDVAETVGDESEHLQLARRQARVSGGPLAQNQREVPNRLYGQRRAVPALDVPLFRTRERKPIDKLLGQPAVPGAEPLGE